MRPVNELINSQFPLKETEQRPQQAAAAPQKRGEETAGGEGPNQEAADSLLI